MRSAAPLTTVNRNGERRAWVARDTLLAWSKKNAAPSTGAAPWSEPRDARRDKRYFSDST
jgi:hypothetical protein